MTNNWAEKIFNPNDPKGFYFFIQDTQTKEDLIEQINDLITKYGK